MPCVVSCPLQLVGRSRAAQSVVIMPCAVLRGSETALVPLTRPLNSVEVESSRAAGRSVGRSVGRTAPCAVGRPDCAPGLVSRAAPCAGVRCIAASPRPARARFCDGKCPGKCDANAMQNASQNSSPEFACACESLRGAHLASMRAYVMFHPFQGVPQSPSRVRRLPRPQRLRRVDNPAAAVRGTRDAACDLGTRNERRA
jgi:hypothetical protein